MNWLLALKIAAGWVLQRIKRLSATQLALIALGASTAFLWANAAGWKARAQACATGRAADRKAYTDAQAAARARALAEKRATELRNKQLKKDADNALDTARRDAERGLAEYIRLHKRPAQGAARRPDLSGAPAVAKIGNRPGESAVLDGVAAEDIKICTENTTRLMNVKDWADSLNK